MDHIQKAFADADDCVVTSAPPLDDAPTWDGLEEIPAPTTFEIELAAARREIDFLRKRLDSAREEAHDFRRRIDKAERRADLAEDRARACEVGGLAAASDEALAEEFVRRFDPSEIEFDGRHTAVAWAGVNSWFSEPRDACRRANHESASAAIVCAKRLAEGK